MLPPIVDPADIIPTADCALAMGECHQLNGVAACTTSTMCDSSMPSMIQPHCDGDRIVSCVPMIDRLVVSQDCAAHSATCAMGSGPFGSPMCNPTGDPCTVPNGMTTADTAHCDTTNAVLTCVADQSMPRNPDGSQPGHISRVACTSDVLEAHCGTVHGLGTCVPNDNSCAADSPDRCDGATLMICVNGHYEGTPCGSLGFARCTQLSYLTAACTNNAQ